MKYKNIARERLITPYQQHSSHTNTADTLFQYCNLTLKSSLPPQIQPGKLRLLPQTTGPFPMYSQSVSLKKQDPGQPIINPG